MLKLQDVTGLTDDDPIHTYLGVVDEILAGQINWHEVHRFQIKNGEAVLLRELFAICNHPVNEISITPVQQWNIDEYREWLERRGESVLAFIIVKLQERDFSARDIRLILMWILANLQLLLEKDPRKHRSIDDEWEI
jgi:hypothetical protein